MSLLEFAQKTNKKGDIAQWVLRKRNKQGSAEPLEDFANNCETEGEKLIAVEMVSVFNDRYFGQWLALRIPFRSLDELLDLGPMSGALERRRCGDEGAGAGGHGSCQGQVVPCEAEGGAPPCGAVPGGPRCSRRCRRSAVLQKLASPSQTKACG